MSRFEKAIYVLLFLLGNMVGTILALWLFTGCTTPPPDNRTPAQQRTEEHYGDGTIRPAQPRDF